MAAWHGEGTVGMGRAWWGKRAGIGTTQKANKLMKEWGRRLEVVPQVAVIGPCR